ncbi:MAG: glycogen synthase [delta proteobacterium ML8_F1]|nr:MAG: glycogen synthase [delta proteobacterium ML8_F1]
MKILFATAEAVPFAKTGGLGDVAYALPKALKALGHEVGVIMPYYRDIPQALKQDMVFTRHFDIDLSWRSQYVGIFTQTIEGIDFYFVDNEYYFKRDGFYGYFDDGERFSYFSKAVVEWVKDLGEKPEIIHCNDWHTGMIPLFVDRERHEGGRLEGVRTLFTIHNLKYQGIFPHQMMGDILGLEDEYFTYDQVEFEGNVNFLKAGVVFADHVTTVSPTYAEEIKTPYYGEGLDPLMRHVEDKLTGIVNGIDIGLFNPSRDRHLFVNYSYRSLEKRPENKRYLQRLLHLKEDKDIPLLAMVTRLVDAKGLDLLLHIFDELMQEEVQLVILGTGDKVYEDRLRAYNSYYSDKFSANVFFDHELSQRIYGAADLFLMPSKYEPCGIGQLIAMRYGALPVVRKTGGLKDTVEPYNKFTREGTGFAFLNYNAHELLFTIKGAVEVYREEREVWETLVQRSMKKRLSWKASALKYVALYESLQKR